MFIFKIIRKIFKLAAIILLILLFVGIALCVYCNYKGITPLQLIGIDSGQVIDAAADNAISQLKANGGNTK